MEHSDSVTEEIKVYKMMLRKAASILQYLSSSDARTIVCFVKENLKDE